jgi:L-lactate utilization protein LutB
LDEHLEMVAANLKACGTKVHWASTGEPAREIILGIICRLGHQVQSDDRQGNSCK